MSSRNVHNFSKLDDRVTSRNPLWVEFVSMFSGLGFQEISYQLAPEWTKDKLEPFVWSNLTPHPWVERSNSTRLFEVSPIVRQTSDSGKPTYWSRVRQSRLSKGETRFLKERDESGVSKYGITIPVFGPFRRNGFIGLDLKSEGSRLNDECLNDLRNIAQSLHMRICDEAPTPYVEEPCLSFREKQALCLMTDGLTNAEIAKAMNVAKPTADTFVKRAYEKLDVTDRVSAVLAFLKH